MITFTDYLRLREGLLAAEPATPGLTMTNTLPITQARRKKLVPTPVRTFEPLAPTITPVAAVVPPHLVRSNRSGS